jgi:hypothetical protein
MLNEENEEKKFKGEEAEGNFPKSIFCPIIFCHIDNSGTSLLPRLKAPESGLLYLDFRSKKCGLLYLDFRSK